LEYLGENVAVLTSWEKSVDARSEFSVGKGGKEEEASGDVGGRHAAWRSCGKLARAGEKTGGKKKRKARGIVHWGENIHVWRDSGKDDFVGLKRPSAARSRRRCQRRAAVAFGRTDCPGIGRGTAASTCVADHVGRGEKPQRRGENQVTNRLLESLNFFMPKKAKKYQEFVFCLPEGEKEGKERVSASDNPTGRERKDTARPDQGLSQRNLANNLGRWKSISPTDLQRGKGRWSTPSRGKSAPICSGGKRTTTSAALSKKKALLPLRRREKGGSSWEQTNWSERR